MKVSSLYPIRKTKFKPKHIQFEIHFIEQDAEYRLSALADD